jgi:hypothetical protein
LKILLEEINIYSNESIRNINQDKFIKLQHVDIYKLKMFVSKLKSAFTQTIQLSELHIFIRVLSLQGSSTYEIFEELISCITKEINYNCKLFYM